MSRDKEEIQKEFNEAFNFQSLLFLRMNAFNMAIEQGRPGSIELDTLGVFIPDELMQEINEEKDKINAEHNATREALLKSWTVQTGHPSNNIYKIYMSPEHEAKLINIRALANQRILHTIINMMYKKGMLITRAPNMAGVL